MTAAFRWRGSEARRLTLLDGGGGCRSGRYCLCTGRQHGQDPASAAASLKQDRSEPFRPQGRHGPGNFLSATSKSSGRDLGRADAMQLTAPRKPIPGSHLKEQH